VVLESPAFAATIALTLLVVFASFWFALPRSRGMQRLMGRGGAA
jgi:hypothetical protein